MFTLAHLSDPHLAPLPEPAWHELAGKRVTGYINWRCKRGRIQDATILASIVADLKTQGASHIAVTGDIANIGLPAEFTRGREWLEGLGAPRDVSFVPGNHDIYVPEAQALAAAAFGPFMRGDGGETFPYVRRRGALALIGVNTGVPTAPFLATGRIGEQQLKELAALLAQTKSENLFRVVMLHHPPVSNAKPHKLLTDASEFRSVIAGHGAELILHGHDHKAMINLLDGPDGAKVPAVGVPSASARLGPDTEAAAYNLYVIDGAPGAWRCEMMSRGIGANGAVAQVRRLSLVA